ncbi:hypothetical protein LNKW23_26170 [Paralimibaculum aggregatum]|uniref:Methyltransferase type 11 domain-containing protein n=1 Tax=Paralimibaculum aggregatum TaxID=3036245 RepID=A0ABQ6LJG9_9RHOB|nr:class I SAM-dependent methyltransferase [Limibaculum sp. NKW23]GMG83404.1 hypothetical protein LNKW23_26170 [Limibaculum sp. NKW23]
MTADAVTRPELGLEAALARGLGPVAGLDAADIGCGSGSASRVLAGLGARVTGVEPDAAALAAAEAAGGGPVYRRGGAEATGLAAGSADLVLFSMSLHHVPDRPAALAEARRLLRPGGRIAVLEPEAPDPLWPVVRWIDDETAVCAAAQAAIGEEIAAGRLRRLATLRHAERYRVATADALIAEMQAVDRRRQVDAAARETVAAAFAEAVREDAQGRYIPFWLRLDLLEPVH